MRSKLIAAVFVVALAGCRRSDEIRHYYELSVAPPAPPAKEAAAGGMSGDVPTAAINLSWTKPESWTEKPATGQRLATFAVGGSECTIVSFPGNTGGLEANLRRWLGQLKVEKSDTEVQAFAATAEHLKSAGGLDVQLFDFQSMVAAGSESSMLAAIVSVGESTVFVKLMGAPALLSGEKDNFRALCVSLGLVTPAGT